MVGAQHRPQATIELAISPPPPQRHPQFSANAVSFWQSSCWVPPMAVLPSKLVESPVVELFLCDFLSCMSGWLPAKSTEQRFCVSNCGILRPLLSLPSLSQDLSIHLSVCRFLPLPLNALLWPHITVSPATSIVPAQNLTSSQLNMSCLPSFPVNIDKLQQDIGRVFSAPKP